MRLEDALNCRYCCINLITEGIRAIRGKSAIKHSFLCLITFLENFLGFLSFIRIASYQVRIYCCMQDRLKVKQRLKSRQKIVTPKRLSL